MTGLKCVRGDAASVSVLLVLLVCAVTVRLGMMFSWYPHIANTVLTQF